MTAGVLYNKFWDGSNYPTIDELMEIFSTEIGVSENNLVKDAEDENTFFVYSDNGHTNGFKIKLEVTTTETSLTVAITTTLMAGGTSHQSTTVTKNSSYPKLIMAYEKQSGEHFMFGFKAVSASTSSNHDLTFIVSKATKFNDSSDQLGFCVYLNTSTATTYRAIGKNYYQTTGVAVETDADFLQLSKAVASGMYICDKLYLPTYGHITKTGNYTIDGKTYFASCTQNGREPYFMIVD